LREIVDDVLSEVPQKAINDKKKEIETDDDIEELLEEEIKQSQQLQKLQHNPYLNLEDFERGFPWDDEIGKTHLLLYQNIYELNIFTEFMI
jgi:hypothetical protein